MLQIFYLLTILTLIGCDTNKGSGDFAVFEDCKGSALGMEHGHIKDVDISASSTFDYHSVGPHIGRARQDLKGGAWCPAQTISAGVREWLEINLHTDFIITGAETMGRYGGGQGQEFAQAYQLEYWRQSTGTWHLYTNTSGHQVMAGNVNTYMANRQDLQPTIVASKVRFLPHSQHPRTVCMRVELFGCPHTSPVMAYNVIQGDQFSPRVYLEDVYDGQEDGGHLIGGLGLLTDGRVGHPLTFTGQGLMSAPGWVGWTNKKLPLEVSFVFGNFQSVQSVTIATFNRADMGIMTPSKISVSYKNIHGSQTKIEDLDIIESKLLENGMAIMKYSLHDCLAKEISLFLHFGSKWIILSEVHFSSETVDAHYIENTLTDEQTEFVKETLKETDLKDSKIMQKEQQQQPEYFSQDDAVVEEKGKEEPNSVVPIANGDSSQMYIGITIGILSMSVLLLLFTIFFMLRKNKHRIFSKHSMFMNSSKGPDVAATDIRLRLSPLVYSVNTRRRISEYQDDSDDLDKQTIYDEPHRPLAASAMKHNSILKNKNKSCDMLCQYENFCIRDQGIVNMNNFGSTPLFNIFTVDQPGPRAPPPTSYSTTNFKDRYPAYDYSTPLRIDTHPKIAAASESDVSDTFYAASDILNLKPETSNSLNWRSFIPSSASKNEVNHY